ncbi:MAG: tetratricopeptide repeat protein [Elusimicrobia bacterium]|nr:tetratricopeptide repeat protein [Elusimicrobiota bacterium]
MKKYAYSALFAGCLLAVISCAADAAVDPASAKAMQDGYSAASSGEAGKAYGYFLKAYELDKANTAALKELAYADERSGNLAQAIARFREIIAVNAGDARTRLDLAYALQKNGDMSAARLELEAIAKDPGEYQAQAVKDLAAMQPPAKVGGTRLARTGITHYAEFFASPYHMTRFRDSIASADFRFHVKASKASPLSFFAGARYVQDSRSKGGIAPEVYNDNILSYGFGSRLEPGGGLSLTAEAFLANNLIKTSAHPATSEGDFRATLAGYWEFPGRLCGPAGLLAAGKARHDRFYTSLGGSLGYYSRYRDNVIGQVQAMEGWRLADGEYGRVSLYLRSMVMGDTKADFFNNLAETGPGVEYKPFAKQNLTLRLDYVLGWYYGREGLDKNPYGSDYHDTRLSLNYGVRF